MQIAETSFFTILQRAELTDKQCKIMESGISRRRSSRLAQKAIGNPDAAERAIDDRGSPEFPVPKGNMTDPRPAERQRVPRKITHHQRQMICDLFQQGFRGKAIATGAGVSQYDLQRELVLLGKTLSQRGGSRSSSRVSHAQEELIIQLFDENMDLDKIARRVDLHSRTVSKVLYPSFYPQPHIYNNRSSAV
ncbi:uncharacterized protein LOC129595666 [Paramacrobiotus metropolitanus]|uniref:uncharacterized protein LOC129595666 n=1 Tax=Paramacrobiotus metropolitanus TaxID=2943436 RepID=UPI00244623BD|nr:uncharacterized protein LOC129595666 [Paramacrobiotus metropolitanus]